MLWLAAWTPRVIDVARSLAPIAERITKTDVDFDAELEAAIKAQTELVTELGFSGGGK